ncbi:cytosolic carboxypeptidase Nna1 isoform X6 [Drosophila tropicalis]|uniref:cytosolic carboxypeptidase Nna1 isoform X6 n=1 Tax=Drosophila tropicalis TaxID=46794 RepID=UPI0035AB778D
MQRATKDKDNNRDNNRSSNSSSSNYNNNTNLEAVNQQQYQYQHHHNLQHQKTEGFLGSFLSKGLKTNQLVVNTDEKTLRPIARLKEPRDLFALPKDKDNDCSQQAPRWPVECQVIEERITHIPYVPAQPEPLNMPTGNELKPRPVGEENGIVVFSYNPISAVNYEKPKAKKNDDSSDESDYSSDSHIDSTPPSRSTPVRQQAVGKQPPTVSKMINNLDNRSTSVSLDEDNDFEDDYDYDTSGGTNSGEAREKAIIKDLIEAKKKRYAAGGSKCTSKCSSKAESSKDPSSEIDDIWKNNSTEYKPASPRYVLSQFGRKVSKAIIEKMCDNDDKTPNSTGVGGSGGTSNKFSRSAVGGAKFVTNCHPMNPDEYDGLEFESRFESGNLAKAVQITPTYYELYLRPDLYTSRSKQWFYFRVRRTHRKMLYRFSIVNLVKSDSLYNDGMQPVMYSTLGAKEKNEGWRRCGDNICYYRNDDDSSGSNSNANEEDEDNSSYTLTFTIEFEHDDDSVYFAHSYPYTYSDLQDYLMEIQRHPVKSKFCKLRLLCRTLAGNNVYYLTVTAPSSNEENMRRKKSIVVSARVHPSETPASWMMKGLMDFITGDTTVAKRLRHKFIFKLVPMLNPDGVIVGNTRNSLTGKDLNRQYRTVIRETYPSIWYTKAMIRRLIEECGVAMYCDMHAHSRKHNIFIYGCENKRNPEKKLTEQVFPLMLHKNSADRFSFESCKFKIQRSKEGTGRIVVWMLGITNSYTIEASFGGSSLGSRKGTHFNTQDYEHMGRAFCETLLDYCDENPNKILNLLKQQDRLRSKIIERLMREGSSADEPLNIPLSDYSSDEGNCSSSSDNEGKHSITASDLEGPCCAPTRAPPSSPEVMHEIRKNRRIRVRSKSSKKRGDLVRTTLDLPTTDPGSDLHFSTDDEEHSPPSGNANYGQVAPLRHTLLQSELQRRYIEEIGDTVVQKPKPAHMPPELIVTTPSKGNSNGTTGKKIDVYKLTPRTAPELEKVHHSGGVGASGTQTLTARRTYSWHNLDQEVVRSTKQNNSFYETRVPPTASAKAPKVAPPPPRRTVPSNFIPQRPMNSFNQADDLQLKLSLKKKIWTGAQGEPDGRPLAWFRGHQSQVQSQVQAHAASAAAQTAGNRSAGGGASAAPPLRTVSGGGAGGGGGGGVMTNGPPPAFIGASATTATAARKPRKLEQMDLFNACSQKLLQWQQQEDQQQQLPHHQHKKLQQTHQQQQQQRLIGGTNVKLDEQSRYKPLPAAAGSQKKSSSLSANKQIPLTSGPPPPQSTQPSHHHHQHHHHHLDKGKRKSNSLIKIAETTQLVTRFARGNRGSAPGGSSNQQQQQQQQQRLLYKTPTGTVGGMAAGSGGRMHSAGAGMQPAIGRSGGGGLPNKFKTGGLVITAVQQPRNVPGGSRRMRNAAAGIGGGGGIGTTTTTTTTLLQYQRSSHSVQMHKSSTGISLDTVNLVRKVKTKLKKRKSRTLTK